jgi:LacI family transcriptional regulator
MPTHKATRAEPQSLRQSLSGTIAGPSTTVSISAVAARAGVSIATVSRVVNGVTKKASADTVARVQQAVAELGYRPMGAGRALRRRESRLVAVLAANLANPSMAAIAAAAEVALRSAGYVMVLCDTHDQADLQDEYLLEMRAHYASGLVLLGAVDSPLLRDFVRSGEPLVFVNRRSPLSIDSERFVGIDNAKAGADVAHWFAQQGFKRLGLVHGQLASSATAERVQGFRAALDGLGLSLPTSRIQTAAAPTHLQLGYQAMARFLKQAKPPDAVFCTSDLIAYGAHRQAMERGLQTGRDITLVGFDDNPLNEWIAPWLHAVRVPYDQYGAAIVQALQAATAQHIILPHALKVRG